MKIVDDFLAQDDFYELQTFMVEPEPALPWYYNSIIDSADDVDKFQFVHSFYRDNSIQTPFLEELFPILDILRPSAIFRIKANLITKTPNIVENTFHIDMLDSKDSPEKLKYWSTSIFYVNTNDGYTKFEDGTKVESIANRLVTFPANMKHTGTSCTDETFRIVINFNWFRF